MKRGSSKSFAQMNPLRISAMSFVETAGFRTGALVSAVAKSMFASAAADSRADLARSSRALSSRCLSSSRWRMSSASRELS